MAKAGIDVNLVLMALNLLPIPPLDGGRILQALLWFALGRARSLLVAAAVGLLTGVGLLVSALVKGSLAWGIGAGLALLFSLLGLGDGGQLGTTIQAFAAIPVAATATAWCAGLLTGESGYRPLPRLAEGDLEGGQASN